MMTTPHAYDGCDEKNPLLNGGFNHCPRCTELVFARYRVLLQVTNSLGADGPSEDALIAQGRNFRDWENGFLTACKLVDARISRLATSAR